MATPPPPPIKNKNKTKQNMESAENGFKRHHLIPFSQKIPRAVAASLTWKKNCLTPSSL